jgi:hypothetical protein
LVERIEVLAAKVHALQEQSEDEAFANNED